MATATYNWDNFQRLSDQSHSITIVKSQQALAGVDKCKVAVHLSIDFQRKYSHCLLDIVLVKQKAH